MLMKCGTNWLKKIYYKIEISKVLRGETCRKQRDQDYPGSLLFFHNEIILKEQISQIINKYKKDYDNLIKSDDTKFLDRNI